MAKRNKTVHALLCVKSWYNISLFSGFRPSKAVPQSDIALTSPFRSRDAYYNRAGVLFYDRLAIPRYTIDFGTLSVELHEIARPISSERIMLGKGHMCAGPFI